MTIVFFSGRLSGALVIDDGVFTRAEADRWAFVESRRVGSCGFPPVEEQMAYFRKRYRWHKRHRPLRLVSPRVLSGPPSTCGTEGSQLPGPRTTLTPGLTH